MKILPVILSGGSGTRLWPVSRTGYPKQLQPLHGEQSLLQQTAQRLSGAANVLPPLVICNAEQRFLVAEQLREIGMEPSLIVLEPVARSTAPAIAVAAHWATAPADTVLVIMPADHFIADLAAFNESIQQAAALAMKGNLMTLGITPTKPHTGFGYIERGEPLTDHPSAHAVAQFKEKPDATTAETYLKAGTFYWNSGIFIFRADQYLAELERLQPLIVAHSRTALKNGKTDLDFLRLEENAFAQCPSISVDYAVMEHATSVGVLPVSFGWSDIGGWPALWQIGEKDANGNVSKGDTILKDTKNSYVRSDERLVATIGLDRMVVVDTTDALLVATMDKADEVKDIVAHLKNANRSESATHARVWRPWGYYERLKAGDRFQVKQIMVKPGGQLSLQMHHHRAEHWVIVSGTAKVTCGDSVKLLGPNESTYIPIGEVHRLENPGLVPVYLIEVQSGEYLGEDDIVRLEDIYKRTEE